MKYYSAIGKDEYPAFTSTWMELEEIMLSEICQAESQLSYGFTYLWNIRNNMEDIRRRKGKVKWGKSEGETNHERLWTPGNKLRVSEERAVGGWASLVMGIKEDTDCSEHWLLHANNKSWNTTSKTNDVLYGN